MSLSYDDLLTLVAAILLATKEPETETYSLSQRQRALWDAKALMNTASAFGRIETP